jgi:hypothetical protein
MKFITFILFVVTIANGFRYPIVVSKYSKPVFALKNVEEVVIEVHLGDGFKSLECRFKPIFAKSKFFVASYNVPFGLNIEKPPRGFPAPIVTKAGSGGEIPGDLLRATTSWSQGFNAAGATSDISMFAGELLYYTTIAHKSQLVSHKNL